MIRSALLVTSLLLWLAVAARAQEGISVSRSCGLQLEEGTLWGLGPDYKTRFLDDAVEFTPALGERALRNLPLRFRLLDAGRRNGGQVVTSPAALPARTSDGLRVAYRRGTMTEIYDVRPEGVEQSFVFDALPEGDGDLIVRGEITTELVAAPAGDDGALRWESPGIGGVRIGAVTGIDALGRRVAGSLAFAGGVLELSLPAAFVAQAALPLVLDPLIGATIDMDTGWNDKEPDAATLYPGTSGSPEYLVVWARTFSGGDVDIRGQRVNTVGTLLGGLIGIRTNATQISDQPRAASLDLRDRYVVVWREAAGTNPSYLAACSVDTTGAVGSAAQVVQGTDSFTTPDVGGDRAALGDSAVAVWANATQSRIEGARLVVSATGSVSVLGRTILSSAGTHATPSIAQDGGDAGRYLIAWRSTSPFSDWIAGALVTRLLGMLERSNITQPSSVRKYAPDVAGDGVHWVVGYDRRVDLLTPTDVYASWVTCDPRTDTVYVAPEVLVRGGSGTQTQAAVAMLNRSLLVAFRELNVSTGNHGGFLLSLDRFSCGPCEGFFGLENPGTRDIRRVASTSGFQDALLVWHSADPTSGVGTIRARAFREDAGDSIVSGSSGCGADVAVAATCSRAGNLGFHVRMEHAEPNRPAVVLFLPGFTFGGLRNCGACAFLDPFRALVFPAGVTDAHGDLAIPLPIPSAISPSLMLSFQFGYLPAGAPACAALGLSFSGLGIVIP